MVIIDEIRSSYLWLILWVLIIIPIGRSTVTDTESLLKLKKSFTNSEALDSWKPRTDACDKKNRWKGVICHHGKVGNLNLGRFNLSGTIDIDALLQIRALRSLSLMENSFSGPIPEFNRLGALKSIFLTGNQFSGEISSDFFAKMMSLKKVWLSRNNFSGEIPFSLTLLTRLIELHLENNQFIGKIPEFNESKLVSLNISYNNLTGEIPLSLSSFNKSSFEGNPWLCGEKMDNPCSSQMNNTGIHHHHHKISKKYYIGFIIAASIILILTCFAIFVFHRRIRSVNGAGAGAGTGAAAAASGRQVPSLRDLTPGSEKRRSSSSSSHSRKLGSSSRKSFEDLVLIKKEKGEFGLADLMRGAAELLGNGELGSAYKVTMANDLTVVVKRIKEMNQIEKNEFDTQLRRLGRLKHRNLLTPLAYHFRKDEKLIVYEYIHQGTLLSLLQGEGVLSRAELNWPNRLKIIRGIARGLGHLHSELASTCELPHGDLKSSNVLLSPNYEPLLADFGFAPLINRNQAKKSLSAYSSPEAVEHQQVSPKSDVYSLGIIILELISGKCSSEVIDIVQWVKSAISEGKSDELVDPEIANSINISPDDVERLILIGAACTESNPEQRLDIREAISRIESIQVDEFQEVRTFQEIRDESYADSASNQSRRSSNTQEG